jgi:hypothetical protein
MSATVQTKRLTPQQEQFVRELVRLEMAVPFDRQARGNAYVLANYKPNPANARRLANTPAVKVRYAEIFAEECERCRIRPEAIVLRIDRVGRANIADFYEFDPKTQRLALKNIKDLPRELTEAIESIKYTEDGRAELKLIDKNQANFTLLKHFGGLPEPDGPRTQVNVFNALSIEDQAALADLIDALPRGRSEAAAIVPDSGGPSDAAPPAE